MLVKRCLESLVSLAYHVSWLHVLLLTKRQQKRQQKETSKIFGYDSKFGWERPTKLVLYYLWIFSTDIIHPLEIYIISYHNSWISLSHSWMVWRIQSSSVPMLYGKITENPSVISTMPCCTRKIKTPQPVFHPVFSPWCIMVVQHSLAVTVGSVRSKHWGV